MTQTGLPLTDTPILPLREAFDLAGYAKRGITFAQATSTERRFRHIALALRLHAEAIAKKRSKEACQQP